MVGIKEGQNSNKMGQCFAGCCRKQRTTGPAPPKQDKKIDDKRMFKLGIDVLNRNFCIQIGYNRKAVKTYGQGQNFAPEVEEGPICETPPDRVEEACGLTRS